MILSLQGSKKDYGRYLFLPPNWPNCTYFCLIWCTYNKDNGRTTTVYDIFNEHYKTPTNANNRCLPRLRPPRRTSPCRLRTLSSFRGRPIRSSYLPTGRRAPSWEPARGPPTRRSSAAASPVSSASRVERGAWNHGVLEFTLCHMSSSKGFKSMYLDFQI